MPLGGNNDGVEGEIAGYVDRLERLDEEKRALGKDFTDLLEEAAGSTGFAKSSFRNILRERRKSRAEIHATYVEMDALRRALKMRDPLLPIEEDDDAPGVMPEKPPTDDTFIPLAESIEELREQLGRTSGPAPTDGQGSFSDGRVP
jgi:uncharacterized protein (UPF0335 family)